MRSRALRTITRHRYPRGLTLIEVLAALVIIGGSVTTMVIAQSNCLEGLSQSRLETTAQHLARELIANWTVSGEDLHTPASGRIANRPRWSWQRSADSVSLSESKKATQITLRLTHTDQDTAGGSWSRKFVWLITKKEQ